MSDFSQTFLKVDIRHTPVGSPEPVPKKGVRRWCFTIGVGYLCDDDKDNFYPPAVWRLAQADKTIKGFVCGREEYVTTEGSHLQGYLELKNTSTLQALLKKSLFASEVVRGISVRLTACRGTGDENRAYCKKGDQPKDEWKEFGVDGPSYGLNAVFFEYGSFILDSPGHRTDYVSFRDDIKIGKTDAELLDAHAHLAIVNIGKISQVRNAYAPKVVRTWKTVPHVFLGPPRAGKSFTMRAEAKALAEANGWRIYVKSDSDDWWPDYTGEEIILIDECHGGFFQWQQLLRFFEEGSYTVRQKYNPNRVEFLGRHVYMTCNIHPALWYKKHRMWDDDNAFRSRISEFGELRVWRHRTMAEKADKIYPPGEQDFDLLAPLVSDDKMDSSDDAVAVSRSKNYKR